MASRNVLCTALLSLLVLLSGCSGGGEGSYLPSGLDTNALAKTFEGTWLEQSESPADPTGKIEIREDVYVFTLEPTEDQHGKYKRYDRSYVKGSGEVNEFTQGSYGRWRLGAIVAKNKGIYSAGMSRVDQTENAQKYMQYDLPFATEELVDPIPSAFQTSLPPIPLPPNHPQTNKPIPLSATQLRANKPIPLPPIKICPNRITSAKYKSHISKLPA